MATSEEQEMAQNLTEILQQNMNERSKQSFLSQISSAHDEVMATFASFRDQLLAELPLMYSDFKHYITVHVNWWEPFVQWLVVFHASMFILLVLFRNNLYVQNTAFFLSVLVVYHAERLNSLLSSNWHMFARENYFDEGGAFVSLMVSLPLLGYMLLVLMNYAVMFMQTLVVMQREKMGMPASGGRGAEGGSKKSGRASAAAPTPTRRSNRSKKKN
jgi:hypothetical protein